MQDELKIVVESTTWHVSKANNLVHISSLSQVSAESNDGQVSLIDALNHYGINNEELTKLFFQALAKKLGKEIQFYVKVDTNIPHHSAHQMKYKFLPDGKIEENKKFDKI